jgi:hypothetical protein
MRPISGSVPVWQAAAVSVLRVTCGSSGHDADKGEQAPRLG